LLRRRFRGRRGAGEQYLRGLVMMPFRPSRRAVLAAPLLAASLGGGSAAAAENDFGEFLAGVRRDALAHGIRPATIEAALRSIQYLPHVIELDQRQPEHTMTFAEFIAKFVTPERKEDVRRALVENWPLLDRVYRAYGVEPRFVVALWGIESNFGKNTGTYLVPSSLATLAYQGRRGPMFRGELIAALRILDEGDIHADMMVGSWAGAMGQCQFMPSTFLNYAVDFDRDGRRDIWGDRADVAGSIANYISRLGWRGNEGWGQQAWVPQNFDTKLTGLETRRPLGDWARLGVRMTRGRAPTGPEIEASLLLPDGPGGQALLVYDNFRTIMRWNKSTYFAATVGYLADSVERS
jgi:membrane-bound lytic murein transglycosylase B